MRIHYKVCFFGTIFHGSIEFCLLVMLSKISRTMSGVNSNTQFQDCYKKIIFIRVIMTGNFEKSFIENWDAGKRESLLFY